MRILGMTTAIAWPSLTGHNTTGHDATRRSTHVNTSQHDTALHNSAEHNTYNTARCSTVSLQCVDATTARCLRTWIERLVKIWNLLKESVSYLLAVDKTRCDGFR
jgi:hypothetical protein